MAIKNTAKQDQKSAVYCSLSQVVQIYTFCASYATTERREWLPETELFMFTEDMPLHAQNNL